MRVRSSVVALRIIIPALLFSGPSALALSAFAFDRDCHVRPPLFPHKDPADGVEPDIDAAIEACGGDVRAPIRAVLIANTFLSGELEVMLSGLVSGYSRGRIKRPAKPEERGSSNGVTTMAPHTIHVVQAFAEQDGGLSRPSRKLAPRQAQPDHWRTGSLGPTPAWSRGPAQASRNWANGGRPSFWSVQVLSQMSLRPAAGWSDGARVTIFWPCADVSDSPRTTPRPKSP
jgi:hypothetical protein